jgi:hypothetical protein
VIHHVLDFRAGRSGGAVVPGKIVTGPEDDLRYAPRVIFLVHGFNLDRIEGGEALQRLAASLPDLGSDVVAVCVLWPGDSWSGALGYAFEGNDADDCASELARFVDRVIPRATPIDFVSHSLGARVVMGCAKRLVDIGYRVGQACLLAPAVDDDCLADPRLYRECVGRFHRVAILASKKDRVLSVAYPAADLLQSFFFFNRDHARLALGYHGPRAADSDAIPAQVYHRQIPDARHAGHGHYVPGAAPDAIERANQASAMRFTAEVLEGAGAPDYP